ncbi:MAG TPA: branched-chain amino acid ABC transporter permease [Acidimicrobiia bacterium]|nr:Amino acid transporter permease protein [Acidimicrobiia bacterium]HYJ24124.1 branched-chain amino acid ABC transporter permease [Acidimicrobiia bacterium]
MAHWLQILVLGLLLGGVYAMMASGLTLLFGVMRVVNLAHAAFILIASYMTYALFEGLTLDPMISLFVTMPLMFGLGVGLYLLLFPRLEESPRYVEMTVLLTFGLALIVEGLLTFTFTGTFRSVRPEYASTSIMIGDLFVPTSQLYASLISFALLILLWVFLRFTKTGTAIRATMQNRAAAQIVGVNVRRISALSFGLGMSLAGAAGSLLSFMFPFFPARHWQWIALLLALIVLGGMGSIKGAVIGALLLAVASAFVTDLVGPTWSPITFYLTLFLILMVRPQGLFGAKVRL